MMRIIKFKNVLSKKALSAVTVLAISGIIPTSLVLAGELVITSELVASASHVNVEQGETKTFNLIIKADGNITDADVTIPTKFFIDANGNISSSNQETKNFNKKDQSETIEAEITADPNLKPGKYSFTFNNSNVTIINKNQEKASLENKKSDTITFTVTQGQVPVPTDTTAPVVTATADRAPDYNDWYNNDVTVHFSAVDEEGGSGLDVSSVSPSVTVTEDGIHEMTGTAKDNAGNEGSETITIKLDKTAPTITGSTDKVANSNGWYNTDVLVSFEAYDNLSGIEKATGDIILSEGENQSVKGTVTDNAGNTNSTTVAGINIDKTDPVIKVEDGGTYTVNQLVTWVASDALSGLATPSSGIIDTSDVGQKTTTISATDKAGNTVEKTISYHVVYSFGGVLKPINKDGSSVFKAGSTIPVKFQLSDSNGTYISTATASIYYAKYTDKSLGTETEAVSTSAAVKGNLFRYDPSSDQYIFNMSTKGLTVGTYQITIKLDDGTTQTVQVKLK